MEITKKMCEEAMRKGADWLVDKSQIYSDELDFDPSFTAFRAGIYPLKSYKGAMKTEYNSKKRKWGIFGPTWHTAQAIQALLEVFETSKDEKYFQSAILAGEFLKNNQIRDENDKKRNGLILAYENRSDRINVSAILEALVGFRALHKVTQDREWLDCFKLAIDWVLENAYLEEGLIMDSFDPETAEFDYGDIWGEWYSGSGHARPLIDDAVFYVAYQEFGEEKYLKVFKSLADRLLKDEEPPGNWINYVPCNPKGKGFIHPRMAFWWGYGLLSAYDAFKDKKYLETGIRTGEWYLNHQNMDGGFYYYTLKDGNHESFDFCTSAAAVAVIFWEDLYRRTKDKKYLEPIRKSLEFILKAQFTKDVSDSNLEGAFFERLNDPDNTENPGYRLRDIATSFSIQAIGKAEKVLTMKGKGG